MAHIVILGAGTGGISAAYGLRDVLDKQHRITLINSTEIFQFVPSNPWVALGWRNRENTSFSLRPYLDEKGIDFIAFSAERIDADCNCIHLINGETVDYDYLVIATGPRLAFELIEGAGPNGGHTHSVCTLDHACKAFFSYENFLLNPGPMVVGAFQGASCFAPAYEYTLALETDLRRRKLRSSVPVTFVTPEPFIGHLGLGGVGDSRGVLESEMRQRQIKWICNAKTTKVEAGKLFVEEYNDLGVKIRDHELKFNYSTMVPPFRGVAAVANVEGLCDSIIVNKFQRSPKFPKIFSVGICISYPAIDQTPVLIGTPVTGYMIESMVTAVVRNISAELAGQPVVTTGIRNTLCLADFGDEGVAFVDLPQNTVNKLTWSKKGKWVHLAKMAYEKYSLRNIKSGTYEPVFEKYMVKALGINHINK